MAACVPSRWRNHHHHHNSTGRNMENLWLHPILCLSLIPPSTSAQDGWGRRASLPLLTPSSSALPLHILLLLSSSSCASPYLFIITDLTIGFRSSGHWMMAVYDNLLNRILGTMVGRKGLPFYEEDWKPLLVHFKVERKLLWNNYCATWTDGQVQPHFIWRAGRPSTLPQHGYCWRPTFEYIHSSGLVPKLVISCILLHSNNTAAAG